MPRPRKVASSPGVAAAPPAPRTSVSMDVGLHAQLKLVAAEESARRGSKVSVADLVAEACAQLWAPSAYRPGPAATPDLEQQRLTMLAEVEQREQTPASTAVFDDIFAVALADPIPDVICRMPGTVQGSFGPLKVSELAYHLRNAIGEGRAILSLGELIADYQG